MQIMSGNQLETIIKIETIIEINLMQYANFGTHSPNTLVFLFELD